MLAIRVSWLITMVIAITALSIKSFLMAPVTVGLAMKRSEIVVNWFARAKRLRSEGDALLVLLTLCLIQN